MTLAQIMTLALRQLDEDPEDISEYDELFRIYANEGHQIAVEQYLKPREMRTMRSDAHGNIAFDGMGISRIVELERVLEDSGMTIHDVPFELSRTGDSVRTPYPEATYGATVEVSARPMVKDSDTPMLPEWAHHALADYICYRHLSNGNMGKQQRAQHYSTQFYRIAQSIRPHGYRSVTREINLYNATDIRRGG